MYAALHRLEFTKRIIASKIIIHNLLKEKDLRRVCIRNIICHNKKFKADSGSSPLRYNPLLCGRPHWGAFGEKMKKKLFILFVFTFVTSTAIFSQNKNFDKIVLLQPNEVLSERCPNIQELSNYIKNIQKEIQYFENINSIGNGYIIIALRPVAKSNVWFDIKESKNLDSLKTKILSVSPCHVQGGVVLFAISNLDNPQKNISIQPKEWTEFIKNNKDLQNIEISLLVDAIWPPEITKNEKKDLLKLINKFKDEKVFTEKNLQKYSDIITYATESEIIKIGINSECWPSEISENEYGPMFLLAYICGNMEKQLITDVYINSQEEGIQFELMKYEQLKKINKNISYKFFEDMLKN